MPEGVPVGEGLALPLLSQAPRKPYFHEVLAMVRSKQTMKNKKNKKNKNRNKNKTKKQRIQQKRQIKQDKRARNGNATGTGTSERRDEEGKENTRHKDTNEKDGNPRAALVDRA